MYYMIFTGFFITINMINDDVIMMLIMIMMMLFLVIYETRLRAVLLIYVNGL